MAVYIIGDNKFGLCQTFETISQLNGKIQVSIVINRPFELNDSKFNNGVLHWSILDGNELLLNEEDECYLTGMSPNSRQFLINLYSNKIKDIVEHA